MTARFSEAFLNELLESRWHEELLQLDIRFGEPAAGSPLDTYMGPYDSERKLVAPIDGFHPHLPGLLADDLSQWMAQFSGGVLISDEVPHVRFSDDREGPLPKAIWMWTGIARAETP